MGASLAAAADVVGSWFAGDAAATAGASLAGDAAATAGTIGAGEAAGAALAGADATAMGGAAGILGAADSAAASAGLGLTAADVGGGALAGGLGGLAADALPAASATAMGPAAGVLGAADSAAASDALGLSAADVGGTSGAALSFLPVTGAPGADLAPLSGDMAAALGVTPDTTFAPFSPDFPSGALVAPDVTLPAAADGGLDATGGGFFQTLGGYFDDAGNWVAKHPATAGLLGLDAMSMLRRPALPSAGKAVQGSATAETQLAQSIVQSGGTSSPQWQTTKASIDADINQQMAVAKAQLEQAAANNGMGGANSMVVQQQLQSMGAKFEAQRQQLYSQALGQIVSQAVTMLSNGNQALGGIAQMQMQQSAESQAMASQIAEMALLLGGGP